MWSNNDKNIVVYDAVGAICTFETKTGNVHSHIAPYSGVAYTDLTVAEDVDRMFVTAKDGTFREILERKVFICILFDYRPPKTPKVFLKYFFKIPEKLQITIIIVPE